MALKLLNEIACKEIADTTDPQEITIKHVRISMMQNTYTATKLGLTGLAVVIGGGVGAVVGTILPGPGTAYGAAIGASALATLVNSTGPSPCDDCKVQ